VSALESHRCPDYRALADGGAALVRFEIGEDLTGRARPALLELLLGVAHVRSEARRVVEDPILELVRVDRDDRSLRTSVRRDQDRRPVLRTLSMTLLVLRASSRIPTVAMAVPPSRYGPTIV